MIDECVPLCTKVSVSHTHSRRSERGGKKEFNSFLIFMNFINVFIRIHYKIMKGKIGGNNIEVLLNFIGC